MSFGKKILALALALCLFAALAVSVNAEAPAIYEVGDVMEDFAVTLSDGTETSLYGMLAEKEMVLINFWASWCGPCRMEFPYMEAAYMEYADRVGVVALSVESDDTDEKILQFKADNGLIALPMGRDNGISERFYFEGIPTSIVVDRFGVICMIEIGSTDAFADIFDFFTGEDYTESVLLSGTPTPVYEGQWPDSQALSAALNAEGSELSFVSGDAETTWPFLVTEEGCVMSSNVGVNKTECVVTTTVACEESSVMCFDAKVSSEEGYDLLLVSVNGQIVKAWSGELDWFTAQVPVRASGEVEITFSFVKDDMEGAGEDMVALKNAHLVTGAEAAAIIAALPSVPQTLSGSAMEMMILNENAREIVCGDPCGEMDDFAQIYTVYIVNDDELSIKLLIGEELTPELCLLGDINGDLYSMLDLEHDEEGMLATMPIYGVADDGYGCNFVDLYANRYSDGDTQTYIFLRSEEDANYFVKYMFLLPDVYWTYADGTLPSTDAIAEPPVQVELPEGYGLYDIYVVDAELNFVEGAMVQVCDETTCEVMFSEDGPVEFVKPCYPYEIHILKVPEGYAEVTETYTLAAEGNANDPLLIVLEKK